MAGWKPALRLARRDALRNQGRSILVLVMIALPVLAVSAADVVYQTSDVAGAESLDRRLGTADARVAVSPGSGRVIQGFDPDRDPSGSLGDRATSRPSRSRACARRSAATYPPPSGATAGVRVDTERGVAQRRGHRARPGPRRWSTACSGSPTGGGRRRPPRWPSTRRSPRRASPPAPSSPSTTAPTLTVVGTAESTTSRGYPLGRRHARDAGHPDDRGPGDLAGRRRPGLVGRRRGAERGRRDRAVARGRRGPATGLGAARRSSRSGRPRPTTRSSRSSCWSW